MSYADTPTERGIMGCDNIDGIDYSTPDPPKDIQNLGMAVYWFKEQKIDCTGFTFKHTGPDGYKYTVRIFKMAKPDGDLTWKVAGAKRWFTSLERAVCYVKDYFNFIDTGKVGKF